MRAQYLIVGFFLLLAAPAARAQGLGNYQAAERRVHGIFLYNLTRYVQWPEGHDQGAFIVGVLGQDPLQPEVEMLARTRKVGGRPMRVEIYKKTEEVPSDCHLLLVSPDESVHLSSVLRHTRGWPMLIVTQKPGLGRAGSTVNFVRRNNRPSFEINQAELRGRRLRCAQLLLRQAEVL
ncbi:MAG: YfiR family protein [Catalinimonas sp.]